MRVFLRMGEEIRGGDSVGTQWETRGKTQGYTLNPKARPQKKVLSLVLCVAMLLSVMVMGTGAAFTDQDEIQNAEAVDMTSALGIIDGYEDGSFQPAENIERGEAAKMISAMLNGGRDSVQETTESSYNDVLGSVDAWANKYIEYCTARGIVSGVGGDRFAPASNVTGTQLAKMLLVSLGYDSVKEGYQDNAMWSVNVNTDAVAAGLYAGIETIDMSAPLSRDNAAQMIWNALQAKTVVYLTDSTGAIEFQSTTLLDKVYGARVDTGIMEGIRYNQDTKNYTYTIQPVDSSAADNGTAYTVESTTDYSDLFAMNVTVLHKDDSAMMIRVNEGGTVVEGVVGDISGLRNDHFNTIVVDGAKYTLDNTAKDWDNFWSIACGYNQYNERGFWGFPGAGARHTIFDQYSFRAIDQDGGGDIDVIVVYPYVVLKTDRTLTDSFRTNVIESDDASMVVANTSNYWAQDHALMTDLGIKFVNNLTGSNLVEYDDVIVNGTVAEEGYVMGTPAQYTATGIDTYTVLDIQSGVANSLNTKDQMITLGETEYNGTLLDWVTPVESISLGETYGFVEVNGYLFIVDGNNIAPVTSEYVVVTKTAAVPHGVDKVWETNILKTDGTTETVDIYVSMNDKHVGPEVGSLYTYRVNLDGDYELIAVPDGTYTANSGRTNFDIQQAYKDGATLNLQRDLVGYTPGYITYNTADEAYVGHADSTGVYDAEGNKVNNPDELGYNLAIEITAPFEGRQDYKLIVDDNGTADLVSDDTYAAEPVQTGGNFILGNDGTTPVGTYYYKVVATWTPGSAQWELNLGLGGMYGTNAAGGYFNDMRNSYTTTYNIEDDAAIFVYNYNLDSYSVVKGADLENVYDGSYTDIYWAFTGATTKVANGTPTVDLGYVRVGDNPAETLSYAYVAGNAIRTTAEGYVVTVDVILPDGEEVTLTTEPFSFENDRELRWFYSHLEEGDIHQLIIDGTTLVGVKDEDVAVAATVAAKLDNLGIIKLTVGGNTANYYVDSDTVYIPVSGEADSIADIVKGDTINVVIDSADNTLEAVIY